MENEQKLRAELRQALLLLKEADEILLDIPDDPESIWVSNRIREFRARNQRYEKPAGDPLQESIDEFVEYRSRKTWLGRLWFDLTRE